MYGETLASGFQKFCNNFICIPIQEIYNFIKIFIFQNQRLSYRPCITALERTVNIFRNSGYNDSIHSRLFNKLRDTVASLTFIWKKNQWLIDILLIPVETNSFHCFSHSSNRVFKTSVGEAVCIHSNHSYILWFNAQPTPWNKNLHIKNAVYICGCVRKWAWGNEMRSFSCFLRILFYLKTWINHFDFFV